MKDGCTIQELASEVERRKSAKLDLLSDTRELTMLTGAAGSEVHVNGHDEFQVDALAHKQIAAEREIPLSFYWRLQRQHTGLFDQTVNTLWREQPARRLVRTLDGRARAYLSDRYRRLDDEELLEAVLPVLGEIPDLRVASCQVTDNNLYLKAVAPRIEGEVKPGDAVQAGVLISNSEVGLGALNVQPLIFRLVCENGMVAGEAVRRFHVGRQIDSEDAVAVFQDRTLRADDEAFWLKVADVVRAAVTETRFRELLSQMQESATSQPIADPSKGVEVLGKRFDLSEGERTSVLRYLALGGDLTRWGALNAVTRASQDVESYDRATELECVGGAILQMDGAEWAAVAVGRTS